MCQYAVADQILLINRRVSALSPYSVEPKEATSWPPPSISKNSVPPSGRQITGWVAGSWRKVTCRFAEGRGYHLSVEGVGTFGVTADGSAIALESTDIAQQDEQVIAETLLGPILLIALAAKGVFCLHASALLARGHAFVFLGDSGAGKSTVAAYLASHVEGWQRIADDALPVTAEQDGVMALPHFPQLKLPASEQIGPDVPNRVPLGGVYLLDVPTEPVKPSVVPLDRRTAAATLIRYTMATSLFDDRLLGPHIDFCASAAAHVPIRRIIYPHDRDRLPEVAALLAADTAETL